MKLAILLSLLFIIIYKPTSQMKDNKSTRATKLNFDTQYNQFYIRDKNSSGDTSSDEFWSDEALNRRLAVEEGILGVGTECYGPVKGEVVFLDKAPDIKVFAQADHIVEGDLMLKSGVVQIIDCPNSAVEFEKELPSGNYRVRIYSINLLSVYGDEGDDFYKIEIWKAKPEGVKLLKEYKNH